jgi:hypothetical protein
MGYYSIERSDEYLQHWEWKKATKYKYKKRGKNGKWIYIYENIKNKLKGKYYSNKSKLQEVITRLQRGKLNPEAVTSKGKNVIGYDNGRSNSHTGGEGAKPSSKFKDSNNIYTQNPYDLNRIIRDNTNKQNYQKTLEGLKKSNEMNMRPLTKDSTGHSKIAFNKNATQQTENASKKKYSVTNSTNKTTASKENRLDNVKSNTTNKKGAIVLERKTSSKTTNNKNTKQNNSHIGSGRNFELDKKISDTSNTKTTNKNKNTNKNTNTNTNKTTNKITSNTTNKNNGFKVIGDYAKEKFDKEKAGNIVLNSIGSPVERLIVDYIINLINSNKKNKKK